MFDKSTYKIFGCMSFRSSKLTSFNHFKPFMRLLQSQTLPTDPLRPLLLRFDFFFWLYHTYSLLRGGFYNASSGFGLWAKTLRGNNCDSTFSNRILQLQLLALFPGCVKHQFLRFTAHFFALLGNKYGKFTLTLKRNVFADKQCVKNR